MGEAHLGQLALAPPSYLPEALHTVLHAAGSSSISGLEPPTCRAHGTPVAKGLPHLGEHVLRLCMTSELSDVTLVLDAAGTSFPAHKLVLALAAPAFQKMFSGGFAEAADGGGGSTTT